MKNLFLYTPRDSDTFRHLEYYLRQLSLGVQLITLPPGSQFTSPLCLELRSNDTIILYAESEEDINDLLLLRDEYDSFKILLIMRSERPIQERNYRLLTPRMVFYLDASLNDLPQYLRNVFQ